MQLVLCSVENMSRIIDVDLNIKSNENFRNVDFTGKYLQIVEMTLQPLEEIPKEQHKNADQFFYVKQGNIKIFLWKNSLHGNQVRKVAYLLKKGQGFVIPANTFHLVKNIDTKQKSRLLTIYSRPEH